MQIYKPLPKGDKSGAYRGPPPHFHLHQTERFKVIKGRVGIEVNDKVTVLRPKDGVAICPAGNIHRFIIDVDPKHDQDGGDDEEEDDGEIVFMVNATDSGKDFVLDRIFLENWYGVRVDSFKYGTKIDFIQQCAVRRNLYYYTPRMSRIYY